jgi:hypothetical protein
MSCTTTTLATLFLRIFFVSQAVESAGLKDPALRLNLQPNKKGGESFDLAALF